MNELRLALFCPYCHEKLRTSPEYSRCNRCERTYPVVDGIHDFLETSEKETVRFYENWHREPHKAYNLDGLGQIIKKSPFIEKYDHLFRHILYTQYKRERFFREAMKKLSELCTDPLILDMGCGGGNPDIISSGAICGVDYSAFAMRNTLAQHNYHMLMTCDATRLPFEPETFDCIVSSDFIGHVPPEGKEGLFSEMNRVLKTGGLCAHVIETDSDNFVKEFAKGYPDLYLKYFIEGIGGHFGLERPSDVLRRFTNAGFAPASIKKYSTYIWDIESFIALFDNEYKEKSFLLRSVLSCYKTACKNFSVKVTTTAVLGFFAYLSDIISPLSKAEGIMGVWIKEH